jgi:hypothetical protein
LAVEVVDSGEDSDEAKVLTEVYAAGLHAKQA